MLCWPHAKTVVSASRMTCGSTAKTHGWETSLVKPVEASFEEEDSHTSSAPLLTAGGGQMECTQGQIVSHQGKAVWKVPAPPFRVSPPQLFFLVLWLTSEQPIPRELVLAGAPGGRQGPQTGPHSGSREPLVGRFHVGCLFFFDFYKSCQGHRAVSFPDGSPSPNCLVTDSLLTLGRDFKFKKMFLKYILFLLVSGRKSEGERASKETPNLFWLWLVCFFL